MGDRNCHRFICTPFLAPHFGVGQATQSEAECACGKAVFFYVYLSQPIVRSSLQKKTTVCVWHTKESKRDSWLQIGREMELDR